MFNRVPPFRPCTLALAAVLSILPPLAHADERSDLEQLRSTTMALMQALIDNGLLSREKADEIVRQAQKNSTVPDARQAEVDNKPKPPVIRVPYISETAKAEMRNQIKQEVLAQSHNERWGEPGALPAWLSSISLEGDLRVRAQQEFFDSHNLAPDAINGGFAGQSLGVADGGPSLGWSPDVVNTQHDRSRLTVRARMGIKAALDDNFSAGIRLSTGNATNPIAATQTQGNYLNKYTVLFDQAYLRYEGLNRQVSAVGGRFGNPFYGTDLTWPDDLNFDGVAFSYRPTFGAGHSAFFTAGAFPLQEFEISGQDRWLYGAQVGGTWQLASKTQFHAGLAMYDFHRIEGQQETQERPVGASAGVQPYLLSQYPIGTRQKGNTLIRINNAQTELANAPVWGLASKFTPINLSMDVTFQQLFPITVKASLDVIKNTGFDLGDIQRRGGDSLTNVPIANQTTAVQAKLHVGAERIDRAGQWQTFLAFRRFERDAWVDAFTDTTWNLGGTNYQGWSIGGNYGVGTRTSIGARWTSTRNLSDPTLYGGFPGLSNAPLKIDVLQVELNTRF